MKKSKKNNGFSLIELLAVIVILCLLFGIGGFYIFNTIKNSKDKSDVIADNVIKKTASTYISENNNDIIWTDDTDNTNSKYTCVSVQSLIEKGYFKESEIKEDKKNNYIIVKKNEHGVITEEEFDTSGICAPLNSGIKVSVPTSKEYCNDLVYESGEKQTLVKANHPTGFQIEKREEEKAGNYKVKATLEEGYVWMDNTTGVKEFTCKIKKATPVIDITPRGEDNGNTKDTKVKFNANTKGTLSLKTSNKDIASAVILDNNQNIETNIDKEVIIKKYSSKKVDTYITFTLKPTDTKNYQQASVVYRIGKVDMQKLPLPTKEGTCADVSYNGTVQTLTKENAGYKAYDNRKKDINKYEVTLRLNYGYTWTDNTTEDKKVTCEIKKPKVTVNYDNNGGSGCTSKTVTYLDNYGELCTPKRTGYTFAGWYTATSGGSKVDANTKVTDYKNHTIYARWKANSYTISYHANGGSGTMSDTIATYDQSASIRSNTFTRTGYTFAGWSTKSDGTDDGYNWTNWRGTWKYANGQYGITNGKLDLYARWNIINYSIDTNPVVNGTIYYSGLNGFTYNVYVNGNLVASNVLDYWASVPYGGTLRLVPNNVTGYDKAEVSKVIYDSSAVSGPKWTAKTYTATMNLNGGTNYGTTPSTWKATYNNTYNIDSYVPTRAGYTFAGWYSEANGGFRFSGNWTWTAGDYTFYAHWRVNVCTIKFDPNGGSFTQNANNTTKTMNYGTRNDNFWNAQGSTYDAKRSGYSPINGKEWIRSGDNKTFDQAKGYNATDVCPNLGSGDQTVTLKVNWGKCWKEYRRRTRTYDSCKSKKCVSGTKEKCYSGYNIKTCKQMEGMSWKKGKCCGKVKDRCASKKCVGGWNSYGSWSSWSKSNNCSGHASNTCESESKTVCP